MTRILSHGGWWAFAAAWMGVVALGVSSALHYEMTAGATVDAPGHWPSDSALVRSSDRPTLVMFAHPHCSCTRASLSELLALVSSSGLRVRIVVVFLKPREFGRDWEKSDLWRTARSIPGVALFCDDDGVECERFCARTSGETLLYDTNGRLMFHGGLTASRGHEGDNAGLSAVEGLLAGELDSPQRTPVFGCALRARDLRDDAPRLPPQ
jgi:hypothetical protein